MSNVSEGKLVSGDLLRISCSAAELFRHADLDRHQPPQTAPSVTTPPRRAGEYQRAGKGATLVELCPNCGGDIITVGARRSCVHLYSEGGCGGHWTLRGGRWVKGVAP